MDKTIVYLIVIAGILFGTIKGYLLAYSDYEPRISQKDGLISDYKDQISELNNTIQDLKSKIDPLNEMLLQQEDEILEYIDEIAILDSIIEDQSELISESKYPTQKHN